MIRRQVVLPAPPDRVWEALVDPEQAQAWMGGRLEWGPLAEGAPLRFGGEDGTRREGRIEVLRPGRYLRFRWWDTDDPTAGGESEVSYLLQPDGGGTRLDIQEREVPRRGPVAQAQAGWTDFDDARLGVWADLRLAPVRG